VRRGVPIAGSVGTAQHSNGRCAPPPHTAVGFPILVFVFFLFQSSSSCYGKKCEKMKEPLNEKWYIEALCARKIRNLESKERKWAPTANIRQDCAVRPCERGLHLFGDMTSFLFYNRKRVKALTKSRGCWREGSARFCDKSDEMSLECFDMGEVLASFSPVLMRSIVGFPAYDLHAAFAIVTST
jgi:hypothetical protein